MDGAAADLLALLPGKLHAHLHYYLWNREHPSYLPYSRKTNPCITQFVLQKSNSIFSCYAARFLCIVKIVKPAEFHASKQEFLYVRFTDDTLNLDSTHPRSRRFCFSFIFSRLFLMLHVSLFLFATYLSQSQLLAQIFTHLPCVPRLALRQSVYSLQISANR